MKLGCSKECEGAFLMPKEKLTPEVLAHCDVNLHIKLDCDVSAYGIGAVFTYISRWIWTSCSIRIKQGSGFWRGPLIKLWLHLHTSQVQLTCHRNCPTPTNIPRGGCAPPHNDLMFCIICLYKVPCSVAIPVTNSKSGGQPLTEELRQPVQSLPVPVKTYPRQNRHPCVRYGFLA